MTMAARPGLVVPLNMPAEMILWPPMVPMSPPLVTIDDDPEQDDSGGRPDRTWQFSKTKMCKFEIMGMCSKGTACPFAHSKDELKPLPDLTCTKLCKVLIQTGACSNKGCKYAHTKDELRATSTFHKTKLCRFSKMGHCALGSKCNFAHSLEEVRQLEEDMAALDRLQENPNYVGRQEITHADFRHPLVPGYLGTTSTGPARDDLGWASSKGQAAGGKKQKGRREKGSPKGGKEGKGGKSGKGGKMPTPQNDIGLETVFTTGPVGMMCAAAHPGKPMVGESLGDQLGMHNLAAMAAFGMPGLERSDWTALVGMSAMGAMAGNIQSDSGNMANLMAAKQGDAAGDVSHCRRPSGGFPQQSNATNVASPRGSPSGGNGTPALFRNPALPRSSSSPQIAAAMRDGNTEGSPAYVMQMSSDFVVKNTFLEFDSAFGGPLRPVRSAAGRLDQLAEQDGSTGETWSGGIGSFTGESTSSATALEGECSSDMPSASSHRDLQMLQERSYGLYRGIDDADVAGGGRSLTVHDHSPTHTGGMQGDFNTWDTLNIADGSFVVDQKDDMWQVKNTFLTFSPQMKPIRSIRTAEGALCSLGDDTMPSGD